MNQPIDSDINISRDLTKVDCYVIQPYGAADGRGVSVSATLLATLAEAVAKQGEPSVLDALTAQINAAHDREVKQPDWVAQLEGSAKVTGDEPPLSHWV